MEPPTDAAKIDGLLPALRRGDGPAFAALYDLMARHLLTFARGLVRDHATAEDVVQDTFAAFARHVAVFEGDGRSVLAFLYTTARRRCLDRHRRARRRPEIPTAVLPEPGHIAPPEVAELDPELRAALVKLTEKQRTAILLRRVVGLDGDEVAAAMEIDRASVYALCARGEARLRRLLQPSDARATRRPKSGGTT